MKYSVKRIIAAIREHRGNVTAAAAAIGCERATLYAYVDRFPAIRDALTTEREKVVDAAEGKLFGMVDGADPWAVGFVLRTLGKSRGYGDVVEVRVEDVRRAFHGVTEATVRVLLERLPKDQADPIIEALRDEWSRVDL